MGKQKTLNEFITMAQNVHGCLYDYSQVVYVNMHSKVTIKCATHGNFEQRPYAHIHNRQGCPACGNALKYTNDTFIDAANKVHKAFYSYEKVVYKNSHSSITITCPIHGDFDQQAYVHLQNHGCPKCANDLNVMRKTHQPDLWSYRGWEFAGKCSTEFVAYSVYVIECWDETETFIKIGKTFTSTKRRFRGNIPYSWKVLHSIEGSADFINRLEQQLKATYKTYNYAPAKKFNGSCECFTLEIKDNIENYIRTAGSG